MSGSRLSRSISPYLRDDQRLADVIAAIQATGTYKYYKLDMEEWARRISGDKSRADHWRRVFEQHPEFFRFDSSSEEVSLILRRQHQKLFNVDEQRIWPRADYEALDDKKKKRFSRQPLSPDEIGGLINVAISLHTRATEMARDRRWWMVPGLGFAGALLGGVLAKWVGVMLGASG